MWRAVLSPTTVFGAIALLAACNVPLVPPSEPSGELVAFGGGPGGAADACFTCHGLKGEGDGKAPRLAGQSAGYLIKQLDDYAKKWRRDPQMVGISKRLGDADRISVSHYYSWLKLQGSGLPREATPGERLFLEGDAAREIRACADCHGAAGRGGLATPLLAGQPADYVRTQLEAFRGARRRNDPQDIMRAIARRLTDEDIDAVARHVAAMP